MGGRKWWVEICQHFLLHLIILLSPQKPLQESRNSRTVCDPLLVGHNCYVHLVQNLSLLATQAWDYEYWVNISMDWLAVERGMDHHSFPQRLYYNSQEIKNNLRDCLTKAVIFCKLENNWDSEKLKIAVYGTIMEWELRIAWDPDLLIPSLYCYSSLITHMEKTVETSLPVRP